MRCPKADEILKEGSDRITPLIKSNILNGKIAIAYIIDLVAQKEALTVYGEAWIESLTTDNDRTAIKTKYKKSEAELEINVSQVGKSSVIVNAVWETKDGKEKVSTVTIPQENYVNTNVTLNEESESITETELEMLYIDRNNIQTLINLIHNELIAKFLNDCDGNQQPPQEEITTGFIHENIPRTIPNRSNDRDEDDGFLPSRHDIREDVPSAVRDLGYIPQLPNRPTVGSHDLDPLQIGGISPGGGLYPPGIGPGSFSDGSMVGPDHPLFDRRHNNNDINMFGDERPSPLQVPPGARYDPLRPDDPQANMLRFPGRGGRGPPGPPDNEFPPPGGNSMFG